MEGVVRDERGGVLPGATVEARNLTVGSAFSVTTAEGGPFRLRFEDGVVTQILR